MQRGQAKTVGFVPTMGALHLGHLSLIARSRAECGVTVCSIFVNPTQFNDPADLARYPRTPEKDQDLLEKAGCDALFSPEVSEMYPDNTISNVHLGKVATLLEGAHRPGHFEGVAQIVGKFFTIIQPERAYFGSKDYQQVLVIRSLVEQTRSTVEVVACPIIRESDGLAMSSRNALLSEREREIASLVPQLLTAAASIAPRESIKAAKKMVSEKVNEIPGMKLDYFEVCDPATLEPVTEKNGLGGAIALIAVYVGKIRLIDNRRLRDVAQ